MFDGVGIPTFEGRSPGRRRRRKAVTDSEPYNRPRRREDSLEGEHAAVFERRLERSDPADDHVDLLAKQQVLLLPRVDQDHQVVVIGPGPRRTVDT